MRSAFKVERSRRTQDGGIPNLWETMVYGISGEAQTSEGRYLPFGREEANLFFHVIAKEGLNYWS